MEIRSTHRQYTIDFSNDEARAIIKHQYNLITELEAIEGVNRVTHFWPPFGLFIVFFVSDEHDNPATLNKVAEVISPYIQKESQ